MSASAKLKALDESATPKPWKSDGPNEWFRKANDTSELASHHWQEQQDVPWMKVTRWNISHHKNHAGDIERIPGGWFGLAEYSRGPDSDLAAILRNALPQIAAVIEAAEDSVDYDPGYADVNDPNPVAAALAALEEELS